MVYPKLIALTGPSGSGKSEVAEILRKEYGYRRTSFAAPLREEVSVFLRACRAEKWTAFMETVADFPKDIQDILSKISKAEIFEKPTSPDARRLLQWWGTDYRRAQDPAYWLKRFKAAEDYLVVDDLRFPNEADLISLLGGTLWYIHRPGLDQMTHATEQNYNELWIRADWAIDNSGTLEDLRTQIREVMG